MLSEKTGPDPNFSPRGADAVALEPAHARERTGPDPDFSPAVATRWRLRTAAIASVGIALPDRVVTNAPIAARIGVADGWIESRTGVHSRRHAPADQSLVDLATAAGADALARADLDPLELDLVIVATFSADDLLPNAAPVVARELGAARAGAFDVGSACTGFLSGLSIAAAQVETGAADNVLVIGAEVASRFLNMDDRRTAALFGDGAGAAVVSATAGSGSVGPTLLRADGSGAEHIRIERSDSLIQMDGHETFKAAVARLSQVTLEALAAADLAQSDVDLFVYHQANTRIIKAVGEKLDLPGDRVIDVVGTLGNTSAASVPLALGIAERDGRLQPGMRVLVAAFGAGFTWGASTLVWGGGSADVA
jgi:3-oxoacyl-[acyl-carrier-protein] synthase-3